MNDSSSSPFFPEEGKRESLFGKRKRETAGGDESGAWKGGRLREEGYVVYKAAAL